METKHRFYFGPDYSYYQSTPAAKQRTVSEISVCKLAGFASIDPRGFPGTHVNVLQVRWHGDGHCNQNNHDSVTVKTRVRSMAENIAAGQLVDTVDRSDRTNTRLSMVFNR